MFYGEMWKTISKLSLSPLLIWSTGLQLYLLFYQVESAIKSCTTYLEGTLDDSNCLSLTKFSETFGLDSVYNLAKRHSLYYFNKVVKHEEFLSLGQQELIDYLSEKYLNVETELNVLDAIDLWVNSNSANEKTESLAAILECFHPEDLMQGEWEEAVKKPVLADTEAGKQWLESNPKPSSTTEQQVRGVLQSSRSERVLRIILR